MFTFSIHLSAICKLFVYICILRSQIAAIGNISSDVRVQEMQKKCDELQKKLDANQPLGGARKKTVKFATTEPETTVITASADMTMSSQQVKRLEEALEAAAKERQEILEAAEKEIEYHRSIGTPCSLKMPLGFRQLMTSHHTFQLLNWRPP